MSAALLETTTAIQAVTEDTIRVVTDREGNPATAVRNDGTQTSVDAMIDLAVAFHVEPKPIANGSIYLTMPEAKYPHRAAVGDWFVAGPAGVGVFGEFAFHRNFRRSA